MGERRPDYPLHQIGPGREEQEQLGAEGPVVARFQRQLACGFGDGRAARLPHGEHPAALAA